MMRVWGDIFNKEIILADIRSHSILGKVTGHFIPLAKNYQDIFNGVCDIKIAGGPAYFKSFSEEEMLSLPYDINGTTFLDKLHTFVNCRALFKEGQGKCIIFQQSSIATAYIALALFYHGRSKVYVIQYSRASIDSPIKRALYRLARNKIDGIICPNEDVGKAYGRPYLVVPDYIYTGEAEISSISFEKKRYDFCIIGRLSPEKGVPDAIRSLRTTNYKVLIAGKPQSEALGEEIRKECEGAANIELHLGYINDEDYLRYIQQSRYSILNYQGEYSVRSSGVVYDMLFNGTPVVGCRCKALKFIEEKGLGLIYDNINNIDYSRLMDVEFYNLCQENIVEYRKSHQQYKEKLEKFILK